MPEWISNLLNLSREISSKIALPIFITAMIIFLLPEKYAILAGFDEFRRNYAFAIGIIIVFSASVLASNLIWSIFQHYKSFIKQEIFVFHQKKALYDLTEAEKVILRQFINEGKGELHARFSDGIINLLENKNVVARASNLAVRGDIFSYVLQPWARTILNKRKNLLD